MDDLPREPDPSKQPGIVERAVLATWREIVCWVLGWLLVAALSSCVWLA